MGYLLHIAFQNQGIQPGILMGFRTHNDPVPLGEQTFMLASTRKAIEDGFLPLKMQNFSKKKGG